MTRALGFRDGGNWKRRPEALVRQPYWQSGGSGSELELNLGADPSMISRGTSVGVQKGHSLPAAALTESQAAWKITLISPSPWHYSVRGCAWELLRELEKTA